MNFDSNPFRIPPAKMKIFAPNGDTVEFTGWIGLRDHPQLRRTTQLFYRLEGGEIKPLTLKVVVLNQDTGLVVYDPRRAPRMWGTLPFIPQSIRTWLKKNPEWPDILELYDNLTEEEESNDGIGH